MAAQDNKSLEQWIWDAACSIRGAQDAPKYKDFILPLVFAKRLCDVFDDEIDRLAADYGSRKTAFAFVYKDQKLVRFYLPFRPADLDKPVWSVIRELSSQIGEQVTTCLSDIARFNPLLDGIINRIDFNATTHGQRDLDDDRLSNLIEAISKKRLGLSDVEPDIIGRSYEYLIRKFAEGSGQSAGEFYTPAEVGLVMARVLAPAPGMAVYDPTCGSGGLLVKCEIELERRMALSSRNKYAPLKLHGQEFIPATWAMANMNMIIHDMEGRIEIGDTMKSPRFTEGNALRRFDRVIANPMWNQDSNSLPYLGESFFANDPFDRFTDPGQRDDKGNPRILTVPSSSADWAWMLHILHSLGDSGRAAVVLDTGAASRGSGNANRNKEKDVRKWFVDHDFIEGVLYLPENLFYNTSAPGVVIFLNRKKPKTQENKLFLMNAGRCFKKGDPKNYLPDEEIARIGDTFAAWREEERFSRIVDKAEIVRNDYNISPSRYIHVADDEDYRPLSEIVEDLHELEKEAAINEKALRAVLTRLDAVAWTQSVPLDDKSAFVALNGLWSGKKPPFVTATVVRNTNFTKLGVLDLSDVAVIEVEARQLTKRELKFGDIIVERSGGGPKQPVGRVVRFHLDESGYSFSNFTSAIRVLDRNRFDTEFVFRVLQYFYESGATDALQRRTTGLRNLDFKAYKELVRIPLISISEQRQIARVLATVQRAIEQQQAIIATTRELKRRLMHRLFTEGLRGEAQKPTEIGLVPESWEIKRIGEVATLKSGGTPSRANETFWKNGAIPWVKTGEVDYCVINDTEEKITQAGLEGSSAKIFPAGTLLMAMYGQGITRGKVGILGIDAATNQACVAFFPKNEVRTGFLYQLFAFKYDYIRSLGHGANQKNLSADILKTVQIAFPRDTDEQDEIVASLSTLDDKLALAERKRSHYVDLFKTLLHQLMTAQLRVHDLDLDALGVLALD